MTTLRQKKHIYTIRNEILTKKFGPIKSLFIKYKQQELFRSTVKSLLLCLEMTRGKEARIMVCHRIFRYILRSDDLLHNFAPLKHVIKHKIYELVKHDSSFANYLRLFGYQCTYIMRNNEECGLKCNAFICPTHAKCRDRRINRIQDNLPLFDKNIINHITEYSINKDLL